MLILIQLYVTSSLEKGWDILDRVDRWVNNAVIIEAR
jgi:hypothetical protein